MRRTLEPQPFAISFRAGLACLAAASGADESDNRVVFTFDGFSILTSQPLLEGRTGDQSRGGSGLTTWR